MIANEHGRIFGIQASLVVEYRERMRGMETEGNMRVQGIKTRAYSFVQKWEGNLA
jgi:hypothetical protein